MDTRNKTKTFLVIYCENNGRGKSGMCMCVCNKSLSHNMVTPHTDDNGRWNIWLWSFIILFYGSLIITELSCHMDSKTTIYL